MELSDKVLDGLITLWTNGRSLKSIAKFAGVDRDELDARFAERIAARLLPAQLPAVLGADYTGAK